MLVLALAGCVHPLECTVADVPTEPIVRVSWPEGAAPAAIDYQTAEQTWSTPVDATATDVDLFGVPPETALSYTLVDATGEALCSGDATTQASVAVPAFEVTVSEDAASPEPYLLGSWIDAPGKQLLFVLDRAGRFVWTDTTLQATDPALMTIDVLPSSVGGGILANAFIGAPTTADDYIRRLSVDDEQLERIDTPSAHHVFVELADGTLAYPAVDIRHANDPITHEDEPIVGDQIVEQAPDGTLRVVWSSWDGDVPLVESPGWSGSFYVAGPDWTHANSMFYQPETDSYLLSLGHLQTILDIDRNTGKVLRSYGRYGDYPVENGSINFWLQHDVRYTDASHTSLTMFATRDAPMHSSGALEYRIDEDSHRLVQTWSYGFDPDLGLICGALGQALPLSNGDVLVSWSQIPQITEVDRAGHVVWSLQGSQQGASMGNVTPIDAFPGVEVR